MSSFLVVTPLIRIIYTSLTYQSNDLRVVREAKVGQFTIYHYLRVFTGRLSRSLFFKPFINSLLVGGGVTLMAILLGTLFAWVLVRTNVPLKRFFNSIIVIPYMMPSWVIALARLIIFKNDRIGGQKGQESPPIGITSFTYLRYNQSKDYANAIVTPHDQVETLTLSDKVAVMDQGRFRQLGSSEEIFTDLITENQELIGTVRPEDIVISKKSTTGSLKVDVYSVLPAASETILTVKHKDLALSIKLNGFTDIRMDDSIWIDFEPSNMNFYDPTTEKLINR